MYHLLVVSIPRTRGIESAYSVFYRIFNILSIYRLFIGGFWRIRVQSVRLLQTKQNFESFIQPLYYLDAMLTARANMNNLKPGKNAKEVIEHLFKWKLGQNPEPKMDNYLYETFEAFVRNKEHIMIDIEYLSYAKESMYKLIMHSIEKENKVKDDSDGTNLIRDELATIFQKAKTVHIDAGSACDQCSFSLIGFLSVLQTSKWKKVTIKGKWISDLWKSSKRVSIEKQFGQKNYRTAYDQHCLIIDSL